MPRFEYEHATDEARAVTALNGKNVQGHELKVVGKTDDGKTKVVPQAWCFCDLHHYTK